MVYCFRCAKGLGYPLSSVRTSRDPCEVCGGFDPGRTDNYSYPSNLIPTPSGYIQGEEDVDE